MSGRSNKTPYREVEGPAPESLLSQSLNGLGHFWNQELRLHKAGILAAAASFLETTPYPHFEME